MAFLTLESLSCENVSTIIPKMMFNPMVVMSMKNETSKNVIPIAMPKLLVIWFSNC